MRIGIHTWGSEGDVRPFFVLAKGLVDAGHEVRMAYSAADGRDYATQVKGARYEHRQLMSPKSPEELRRIGGEIFADANQIRQFRRVIRELLEPTIDAMVWSAREIAQWADLLVLHPFAHPLAAAAEAEGKPFVCMHLAPLLSTRAFPPTGRLPNLGFINALFWTISRWTLSMLLTDSANQVRARFGLSPINRVWEQLDRCVIDLVLVSPTLLPRPDDWQAKAHLCGCLIPPLEPREAKLSAELEAFLADGPAPVYVTFGSMSWLESKPRLLIEQVEQALATVGCRAIVQSEVPGPASPNVFRVRATAHDQVFPRCSAIIHHGGVGTTQAALRAGRPSVVVAHISDQFLWGRQLHRLGVSPAFLDRAGLKSKALIRAIEQATQDTAMRAEAERLGRQMREEDGLQRAVELLSHLGVRTRTCLSVPV